MNAFRLVGGTALSLQLGHRISVDIDMFSDADYGSVDFIPVCNKFIDRFAVVIGDKPDNKGFGISFLIGDATDDLVKLDMFYTDGFIFPPVVINNIRMADIRDIAVMKLEVISNGGRKKDFWDISELLEHISFDTMLKLYLTKYPYADTELIIRQMINFSLADEMADPVCLRGKYWEIIKLDLEELVQNRL